VLGLVEAVLLLLNNFVRQGLLIFSLPSFLLFVVIPTAVKGSLFVSRKHLPRHFTLSWPRPMSWASPLPPSSLPFAFVFALASAFAFAFLCHPDRSGGISLFVSCKHLPRHVTPYAKKNVS
jgi:hypothetical protein